MRLVICSCELSLWSHWGQSGPLLVSSTACHGLFVPLGCPITVSVCLTATAVIGACLAVAFCLLGDRSIGRDMRTTWGCVVALVAMMPSLGWQQRDGVCSKSHFRVLKQSCFLIHDCIVILIKFWLFLLFWTVVFYCVLFLSSKQCLFWVDSFWTVGILHVN